MMKHMLPALKIFLFFTLLTGGAYPLLITAIAQWGFSQPANGSFIHKDGRNWGSALIAQKFESPKHFFSRPSAVDYNPLPSGGSNLGPTSQDLATQIEQRRKTGVTDDLLVASASGLDPEVSIEATRASVPRVIEAWKVPEAKRAQVTQEINRLIDDSSWGRQFNILGEPRVNILKLNLALDEFMKRENLNP